MAFGNGQKNCWCQNVVINLQKSNTSKMLEIKMRKPLLTQFFRMVSAMEHHRRVHPHFHRILRHRHYPIM